MTNAQVKRIIAEKTNPEGVHYLECEFSHPNRDGRVYGVEQVEISAEATAQEKQAAMNQAFGQWKARHVHTQKG